MCGKGWKRVVAIVDLGQHHRWVWEKWETPVRIRSANGKNEHHLDRAWSAYELLLGNASGGYFNKKDVLNISLRLPEEQRPIWTSSRGPRGAGASSSLPFTSRLRERWFIKPVVSLAAINDDIDNDVLAEVIAILEGDVDSANYVWLRTTGEKDARRRRHVASDSDSALWRLCVECSLIFTNMTEDVDSSTSQPPYKQIKASPVRHSKDELSSGYARISNDPLD
ncbi:hypothetical protein DEU56DRAFT_756210 [Suillus clintonianus]|uniref:uncharacterized protein n=1 Tax=Suillus clintonianus TaxID=1904413 RepID=UPI001B8818CD|nr:uncharacterized protein DEU56DRAFT_756210 [Suillus clintonianus]KAG2137091.1 hypothetical protein DEU56DRAFT_756210 [Suillus clintonianus]